MSSSAPSSHKVRVRFAPSPTGYLHIGGARTVLFNWLLARKDGGRFILRIEDTDQTRHVEDSVGKILDDLRWLGLDWDEGPEVGGDCGPYFQSQRLDLYNKFLHQLLTAGDAYYALETPEELATMREVARAAKGGFRYPRPDPIPTMAQGEACRAEGKSVVVRFKMPEADITFVDDILGEVTLASDQLEDFVIQKSDGFPTYHFACVVDDELMKITHVLRGQEHLMNTPKHVALQRALGFGSPRFAHLPVIFNMDGSKMSKRDKEKALQRGEIPPEIEVRDFRVAGYLPEAVVNFIALLGWNPGKDAKTLCDQPSPPEAGREQFSRAELVELFSLDRVGKANARFDRVKLQAFNTDWAARVGEDRLLEAYKDFLAVTQPTPSIFQPTGQPATDTELRWILTACAGFRTFRQVEDKVRFLFTPDDRIEYDAKAVKKVLAKNEGAGYAMLEVVAPKLAALEVWTAEAIQRLLESVCAERDAKLGQVAQPLRVAITGTTISPSIHESLERLGRARSLARITNCGRRK